MTRYATEHGAYDAARRRYKQQQKAANRAELRNAMIRLCLDAAAASS